MKAIISNHKRSAICSQEITFEGLQKFVGAEFPRTKEVTMTFTDAKGEIVKIVSEEDVALLKKINDGQKFVEISIEGKLMGRGHRHHHGHSHGHKHRNEKGQVSKEKPNKMNRKEKRMNVLAKIYGGSPNKYEKFQQQNNDLKMGKLIKAYAESNGIEIAVKKDKGERKTMILSKAFGGSPQDYVEFYKANENLKVGQLIQKFSEEKGVEPQGKKDKSEKKEDNQARIEKKIKRLSIALGNPHETYEEASKLVRENPKLNVKQILEKLQKEGRKVDFQKFRELRRQEEVERKERFGSKKEESSEKAEKFEDLTPGELLAPKSLEKPTNKKQIESREKGRILMEMKDIFGKQRSSEYFKFIEENFHEGEEGIIEKWIQTHEI